MKVLILYATKNGASYDVAKYIAKNIKDASKIDIVNIKEKRPNVLKYDKIIIGSGIYGSKINKELNNYIQKYKDDLLERKFAFYFCCGTEDIKKRKMIIDKNFTGVLASKAMAISCAGGKINPHNNNWFNKLYSKIAHSIYKMQKRKQPQLEYDEIDKFIELINAISVDKDVEDFKINPVPRIDDVITAKEKVKHTEKGAEKSKNKRLTPQTMTEKEKSVLKEKKDKAENPKK